MKNWYIVLVVLLSVSACEISMPKWEETGVIDLGDVTPIGLAMQGESLWIADGDHNQIVAVDLKGNRKQTVADFERPMHLAEEKGVLYIPEYGSDQIIKFQDGTRTVLEMPDSLDAPAGVDVVNNEIAIADFYNHRIVFFDGKEWLTFGKEGKAKGEFYYPTDVAIAKGKIFVADAYNNRIQVFDKKGIALQIIGEAEKMNAATGIYVGEEEVFITDFENNRVLVYDLEGALQQIIAEGVQKPTDVLLEGGVLYIANYGGKDIRKLER